MKAHEPSDRRPWQLTWSVVFAVNLIVPLFFAWRITSRQGRLGMVTAIVLWWLLGSVACARSRRLGFTFGVGGACIGLSQLWPLLQLFSGAFCVGLVNRFLPADGVSREHDMEIHSELGGFCATMLTGGLLIAAAVCCGGVAWLVFGRATRERVPRRARLVSGVFDRDLDG